MYLDYNSHTTTPPANEGRYSTTGSILIGLNAMAAIAQVIWALVIPDFPTPAGLQLLAGVLVCFTTVAHLCKTPPGLRRATILLVSACACTVASGLIAYQQYRAYIEEALSRATPDPSGITIVWLGTRQAVMESLSLLSLGSAGLAISVLIYLHVAQARIAATSTPDARR